MAPQAHLAIGLASLPSQDENPNRPKTGQTEVNSMNPSRSFWSRMGRFLRRATSRQGLFATFAGHLYRARYWFRNRFSRSSVAGGLGPVVSLTSYSKRVRSVYLTL